MQANLTRYTTPQGAEGFIVDYDPKVQDHVHVCPWPSDICTLCGLDVLSALKLNNPELFAPQR